MKFYALFVFVLISGEILCAPGTQDNGKNHPEDAGMVGEQKKESPKINSPIPAESSTVSVEGGVKGDPQPPPTDPPTTPKSTTTEKPTSPPTPPTTTTVKPTTTTVKPTTTAPPTNSTTVAPTTTPSTTTTTAAPPTNTTTASPAPVTTVAPEPHNRFDGPSFMGGIVLSLGLVAIGFIGFKYYKARCERHYRTL